MKRILSAIGVSSILMLTLSGCMSINAGLVINPDGKTANAEFEVSYDREKMSAMMSFSNEEIGESKLSCDEISEMMKESETGLPSENKDTKWEETDTHCIMKTTEIISYDESGTVKSDKMDKETEESTAGFKITKDGHKVFVEMDLGGENASMAEAKMFIDEFNLSVTYPEQALSANNDGVISKDGKTVTWDMLKANDGNLKAVGTLPSSNIVYILSGIGIIALIGTGLVFTTSRAKKKKSQAQNTTVDSAIETS